MFYINCFQRLHFWPSCGSQGQFSQSPLVVKAIWVRRVFPSTPLVVFFGPPLLLGVADFFTSGGVLWAASYWENIEDGILLFEKMIRLRFF